MKKKINNKEKENHQFRGKKINQFINPNESI